MKQYKKSLYKYFILLAMGGCTLLTGCNDFLTTIPESSYSAAGSYQSQSDFDYAIAAVYAAQQELYKTNDCWYRLMIARSDDTRNGAGYTFGVDQFTDSDDISYLSSAWQKLWTIISRSNMILDKIDAVDFPDANLKNAIKGEAYTLRAWSYYTLGWMFGGMPLIDKERWCQKLRRSPALHRSRHLSLQQTIIRMRLACYRIHGAALTWAGSRSMRQKVA